MKVRLCLDRVAYTEKRKAKAEIQMINKRILESETEVTLKELAECVGKRGCTFSPSTYQSKKNRTKENFKEMQVVALDFDSGCLYETIKDKFVKYDLPFVFSYSTLSSTQEYPKYRILLCHIVPIKDHRIASFLLEMLKRMFLEADRSCFETARIFFGGRGVIEYNEKEELFHMDTLIYQYQRYEYERNAHNFGRDQKMMAKRFHIGLMHENLFDIQILDEKSEEFRGKPIEYIIELPQISSKIVFYGVPTPLHQYNMCSNHVKHLEKVGESRICQSCRLWKDFREGVQLEHQMRFLLATNILYIKGMKKRFLHYIETYYHTKKKWEFDLRYMKAHAYHPQGCENCIYHDTCDHDINLVQTLSGRRRILSSDKKERYVSIEEGYEQMENALRTALACRDDGIHLIKAQTGLGKTHAYETLIRQKGRAGEPPILVAVPLVRLKNEIANRLGEHVVETVSLDDLVMPSVLREKVQILYNRGLHKEAKRTIREYADTLEESNIKIQYKEYLDFGPIVESAQNHIIMTHVQFLQFLKIKPEWFTKYQVIIDEDILYTMLRNTDSISAADVETALSAGLIPASKVQEIKKLLGAQEEIYLKSRSGCPYITKEEQDRYQIEGNLNGFLNAGSYHKAGDKIDYYAPYRLPKQKLIVMSATLEEQIYREFFKGRNIVMHETDKMEYKGHLYQYTYHSMSRRNLYEIIQCDQRTDFIEDLKDAVRDWDYGICFKEYEKQFGKNGMHFGNVTGIDKYKGKNGLIIGTPHLTESCYKLIACYMGIQVEKLEIRKRKVEFKGYSFFLMSYENEVLRNLQLYMISSELEQAIGRSRLLRTGATVYLFSNFPCEQAHLYQKDYLSKDKIVLDF